MKHPFAQLEPEYTRLLAAMKITQPVQVEQWARRLLGSKTRYVSVSERIAASGKPPVPAAFLAGLHMRESSANFGTYLGNGQSLHRITTIVPKGRGPFASFEEGAVDGIRLTHLDDNSSPWTEPYACWKGEIWNGFGYRAHGVHSPYDWAGTNIYGGGKYVRDGVFDRGTFDTQLGIIPVMRKMIELSPDLAFGSALPVVDVPATVTAPAPVPDGVGGGPGHDVWWVQRAMRALSIDDDLPINGNYDWRTRESVRAFQSAFGGIKVDGLAGPETKKSVEMALTEGRLGPLPDGPPAG